MRACLQVTELGAERRCSKCGDWWPDDAEFFYRSKGKSRQPCKACYEQLPSVIRKRAKQRKPESAERWVNEH